MNDTAEIEVGDSRAGLENDVKGEAVRLVVHARKEEEHIAPLVS